MSNNATFRMPYYQTTFATFQKLHVFLTLESKLRLTDSDTYTSNYSESKMVRYNLNTSRAICNYDYGVNIGQVTSSRLCRICTNLRIVSEISGVSRKTKKGGKISILGSQKSKKVTKILNSHQ